MLLADPVRRRRALRVLGGVLALVVAVSLVGVTVLGRGGDPVDEADAPTPTDTGTPLTEVDTTTMTVPRAPFCESVPPESVLRALDLPAEEADRVRAEAWENGQETRLEQGLRDVTHEDGCSWRGPGGVRARAWVFVPPTTTEEARTLRADAPGQRGCTRAAGAPAYGSLSVATDCQDGPSRERTFAGLFGDAWLTCALAAPRQGKAAPSRSELAERASTWCSAVVSSAGSGS